MSPENPIIDALTRHEVPFVLIGGLAVVEHGHVRATEDTDLIFRRTPMSEKGLLAALQELKACWISHEKDPATGVEKLVPVTQTYLRTQHMMMLITSAGFLDLFDYIPGFPDEPVDSLFADSELRDGMRFASLPWLLKMKRAANRPKDLDDIANLTA